MVVARLHFIAVVVLLLVVAFAGGAQRISPSDDAIALCGLEGFYTTETGGEVMSLSGTVAIHSIRGFIRSETGAWPEGTVPLFELRPPRSKTNVFRVRADGSGWFELKDIEPGVYCFKATATGWASVMGVVNVSPEVSPQLLLAFEMPLAN